MARYFVAIPLPDDAKDRLVALRPPAIPGMRQIGRDELHLTLHFLGEVPDRSRESARSALETIQMPGFPIIVGGLGVFSDGGCPRVLWAGVEGGAALDSLHRAVGEALGRAIGFRPERRPYSPHITLARFNHPPPPGVVERHLAENGGFRMPAIPVDRFILYSSDLSAGIPQYREESTFGLVGDAAPDGSAGRDLPR